VTSIQALTPLPGRTETMKIGIVTVLFKSDNVIDGFIESMNSQTFDNFHIFFVENDVANLHCERARR
jgi:pyruvate/oxaloacetate carboxyltransferase